MRGSECEVRVLVVDLWTLRSLVAPVKYYQRRGPALGGPGFIDFTLHVFRDLVCGVTITFKTTVPSALALGASGTSHRLAVLADCGRWHCSRVPRVLAGAPPVGAW